MPAQADLIIANASAVNKTFKAMGVANGIAKWADTSSGILAGYVTITMSMRWPNAASEPVRHTMKINQPIVVTETINSVSYLKVQRRNFVNTDVVTAQDSTSAEKADLMAFQTTMTAHNGTVNLGNQVKNNEPTT